MKNKSKNKIMLLVSLLLANIVAMSIN